MRNGRYGAVVVCALGAALALAFGGCDIEDSPRSEPVDLCDLPGGTRMVGGDWVLSGSGRRSGCQDSRFDTDSFTFQAVPFRVGQYGSLLQLDAAPRLEDGWFEVTAGRVSGKCVQFSTVESYSDGPELVLAFEGDVVSQGTVLGSFTGTGPAGCDSKGTFRLEVTCCAGTGPSAPEPDVVSEDVPSAPEDVPSAPEDVADVVDAAADDAETTGDVTGDADAGADVGAVADGIHKPHFDTASTDVYLERPPVEVPEPDDDTALFTCTAAPRAATAGGPATVGALLLLALLLGFVRRRRSAARVR